MSKRRYRTVHQYEPLLAPESWGEDGRRFVARLTEILDDIYRRYGRLSLGDVDAAFRGTVSGLSDAAKTHAQAIGALNTRLMNTEEQTHQALQALQADVDARVETSSVIDAVNQSPESARIAPDRLALQGAALGALRVTAQGLAGGGLSLDAQAGELRVGGLRVQAQDGGNVRVACNGALVLNDLPTVTGKIANLYVDAESGELMRVE